MRSSTLLRLSLLQASPVFAGLIMRQSSSSSRMDSETKASLDQTWRNFTEDEFCADPDPKHNPDDAARIWKDFKLDKWFDDWLDKSSVERVKDWTYYMDRDTHNNGGSQYKCEGIDSPCDPPLDCRFAYQQGMGPSFWILDTAAAFHSHMHVFWSNMTSSQTDHTLRVDGMIEDLGRNRIEEGVNLFGILNGAFTIAAAATAPATAVSSVLAIIAGALGIAGSQGGTSFVTDPSIEYEKQVYESFGTTITAMEKMIRDIFTPNVVTASVGQLLTLPAPGLVQAPEEPDPNSPFTIKNVGGSEIGDLPGLTGEAKHPLARFFADGKFLHHGYKEVIEKVQQSYESWHRAGLAAQMLKDDNFVIVINTDIKEESKCKDDGGRDFWDEEHKRCYRTMRQWSRENCPDGPQFQKWAGDAVNTAIRDYNMARKEYYRTSYDCAKKHPDGKGKVDENPSAGTKMPECFFNMPVVEGSFDSWGGPGIRLKGDSKFSTLDNDRGCAFKKVTHGSSRHSYEAIEGPDWHYTDGHFKAEIEHL